MPVNAFTISSNNYLGMARVFAESYLAHHPGAKVFTCLVDRRSESIDYGDLPFEIIAAEDLEIPDFPGFAFRYDILELNTAVKPFVFRYLRDRLGLDRAFYFDPDILIHDRLSGLEEALDLNLAVLTPHLTRPIDNRCRPPERVIGMCGVYNLGFLGLRLDVRTTEFVDWWCDRLDRYCFVDLANGMFVDQSWMDFAPTYLESVAIMRDPIYNIAYWNLPHRHPVQVADHWQVDGRRMGFFHFSGVDLDDLYQISRHQDRVDLGARPELRPLFEGYRDCVRQSGQHVYRKSPYHFDRFKNTDITIPSFARVALQETDPSGIRWPDPFDTENEDSFFSWLVEPFIVDHRVVHRAALFLWRQDQSIQAAFPVLEGDDLASFLEWYVTVGAEEQGLHEVFYKPLNDAQPPKLTLEEKELERISLIELSHPGDDVAWLNGAVDSVPESLLTRLAMAIHRSRNDLMTMYPDPKGADRDEFAYWMVTRGGIDYGLHADLVDPIRSSLALKTRVSIAVRNLIRGSNRPTAPMTVALPSGKPDTALGERAPRDASIATSAGMGINLCGHYEGVEAVSSFVTEIGGALSSVGLPQVPVPVDHELPELMTSDRIRFDHGAPYPVTVLVLPTGQWNSVIEKLPSSSRWGGRIVGFCTEPVEMIAPPDMVAVDEVWVPTHREAHRLVRVAPVPVRPVLPPPADGSSDGDCFKVDLDRRRFWFLVIDHGRGAEDEASMSTAIECVRRLDREGGQPIGVCLMADPAKAGLVRQLRHLPVEVVCRPQRFTLQRSLLESCDALLDLRIRPRLEPVTVEAALLGVPTISTGWYEIEEVVDSGSALTDHVDPGPAGSSSLIEWGMERMLKVAEGGSSGQPRFTAEEVKERRGRWMAEARDQWRREIARMAGVEL
jgi:hypothetical protein